MFSFHTPRHAESWTTVMTRFLTGTVRAEMIALFELARRWNSFSGKNPFADKPDAENAIARAYESIGLDRPLIIWCKSPFALAVMPFLFQLASLETVNQRGRKLHAEFRDGGIKSEVEDCLFLPEWKQAWREVLCQLPAEGNAAVRLGPSARAKIVLETQNLRAHLSRMFVQGVDPEMGPAINELMRVRFEGHLDPRTNDRAWELSPIRAQLDAGLAGQFGVGPFLPGVETMFQPASSRSFSRLAAQMEQQLNPPMTVRLAELLMFRADDTKPWYSKLSWATTSKFETARLLLTQFLREQHCEIAWGAVANDGPAVYEMLESYAGKRFYDDAAREKLNIWTDFYKASMAYLPLENICFACEYPTNMLVDERGRLHCEDGPAISFSDGLELYFLRGIPIDPLFIRDRQSLTVGAIEAEFNLERRRVLMDLYGTGQYVLDSGAVLINKDECGAIYRKDMARFGEEPIMVVRVINSTPEPDGSWKEYFLRVPPTVKSAREAVAWTFGLTEREYLPAAQT